MDLAAFIRMDIDQLVAEWEAFARSSIGPAKHLDVQALRDHARVLLLAVADDMEQPQLGDEQDEKSRGGLPQNSPQLTQTAQNHAEHRFSQGFALKHMVSEYRALRASVLGRWRGGMSPGDETMLDGAVRFGEAMDQGLTESISWYVSKGERARGLLLAVLCHDLRTPLGAAAMSARYLMQTEGLDSHQMKAVVRIVNAGDRMKAMIEDILDFTQTSLGMKLPLVRASADLGALCGEVVAEVSARHPGSSIRLEREGDLGGTWDGARIAQLLANLISNAVEHGSDDGAVTVWVQGQDDVVSLRVHNCGRRIAPEALPTLFDPLKQSPAGCGRQNGSSGLSLGLYIAREIASAHGGSIDVASTEEDGTTFTARLPRGMPDRAS